jgi:hypothetical protein
MTIGIIDTGVDYTHQRLNMCTINGITLFKDSVGNIITKNEDFTDHKGHGTGIASIIKSHLESCNLYVIKLDSHNSFISEDLLTEAIFQMINSNVNIINISMGINSEIIPEKMQKAVNTCHEKGIPIFAANYYDYTKQCFPANFSNTFSIGTGYIKEKQKFKVLNNDFDIIAKGGFQRVAVPDHSFAFSVGTSLATAHITGIVCNAYTRNEWKTIPDLKKWLKENSDESIFSLTKHDTAVTRNLLSIREYIKEDIKALDSLLKPSEKIKKTALFPFDEKEIQSIIENKEHSAYEISLIIDTPRNIINKEKNTRDIPLKKKLEEDDFSLFDTLITGYFNDLKDEVNTLFGLNLIRECLLRNKNFILWDHSVKDIIRTLIKNENIDYKGEIFLTHIDNKIKKKIYANISCSFEATIPSICVIGTNSRQGKFTTQLKIKKILESNNYNVSFISTEPQGAVLGADSVFPFGHKSSVNIDAEEWYHVINALKNYSKQKKNPDILITGIQSGIIPKYPVYANKLPEKLIYTNAFYPDALICTISPDESLDFIERTTSTVKSYNFCEVLFYCLTPWVIKHEKGITLKVKLSSEEYKEKLQFFSEKLNKPVIDIKDDNNSDLIIKQIQNYFKK